ncbi:hypothetical protein FC093_12310 [Ilyomonas limi]|uniref:Uncharacterized protein n=1 Tax=Ilyomonas limi TaxID=2575867 RepID=A0A4V5UUB1_9BACT|nr:choice-of-anchor X domain-containing protein [Ilyomonas limi]TKK67993.1 hypothetical protein FC093_12310 [Ilyomonas limi]
MRTLKRPLVVVSTLITVILLLSWRYFDDYDTASQSYSNELTDEALLAFMAESGGDGALQQLDVPPAAEDVLVQRIKGDNSHLLLMAFYSKENYSKKFITIENGFPIVLRDDGKDVDKTAGDGLYTARIPADVQAFRKQAVSLAKQMRASGYKPVRYVRRQMIMDPDAAEDFQTAQFDANEPVSISGLTNALGADFASESTPSSVSGTFNSPNARASSGVTALATKPTLLDSIKQNSILITNLAVVEDPTRTWNYCTQKGNVNGPWTFGTLMRQAASKGPGQIASNARVSNFVKNWLNSWTVTQVVNGDTIAARTLINSQILNPWVTKSKNAGAINGQLDMRFAPFKLIAIVNRFDLRDGRRFGLKEKPCGEARFIFTLIKDDCSSALPMTVIFEYGVNMPNTCEAQHNWAQQWVNLKNFALGSNQYNQALQNITDQFTLCGTNTSKPNQSSLDQLRTNEVTLSSTPKHWEFREFIIDSASGNLKEITVAQNPADKYNAKVANADVQRMVAYVNNHAKGIKAQRNIVPLKFQGAPFLGGGTEIIGPPTGNPPNVFHWDGTGSGNSSTFIIDNDARFNFSLATCGGCHGGETQTHFTHVDTAFFGKEAKLSGFLTGTAGSGGAIDFDNDPTNNLMTVKDPALRPSSTNPAMRTFNDLNARAKNLKSFVSTTCGSVLSISSELLFQPINMVD